MKGIRKDFLNNFQQIFDCKTEKYIKKQANIYRTFGPPFCLLYVLQRNSKGKSKKYQNWSVRKKVIDDLQKENKDWFLVLLSGGTLPNYLLRAEDVIRITESKVWKCNKSGDYKTTSKSLIKKYEFDKTEELKNHIENDYFKNKNAFEKEIEEAQTLSPEERQNRLKDYPEYPKRFETIASIYKRNPNIVAEVLERAKGKCECCKNSAPFIRKSNKTPYLEVHHKISLTDNGADTIENAIALCPNCHRKAHYGEKQNT